MLAAARAAARAGVPYVLTPRGMLIRDVISRKSRWAKTAWINLFERKTLAQAAAVHVTAELEGAELRAMGLPSRHIACIPNGVDWPRAHLPLADGPYSGLPERYVLFLSRISWKKGLDRLITAWQWIRDVPAVIAGNDDEGYRPQLQELAQSLGISARVIFLGSVGDTHKWALYEHAQLFVLPSYSENFGNVVAEAMAMSCPVVLTAEVGIASIVEATGAGMVVDGAPEKLATVIRELLADPQRRAEMGRRGAAVAKAQLSWSGVAAAAEDLYQQILAKDSNRALAVSSVRRQLAELSWVVGGQVLTALGTIVGVRILTQYLSPGAYGVVSLAMGMSALAISLVAAPLTQAAIHFYPGIVADGLGGRAVQLAVTLFSPDGSLGSPGRTRRGRHLRGLGSRSPLLVILWRHYSRPIVGAPRT